MQRSSESVLVLPVPFFFFLLISPLLHFLPESAKRFRNGGVRFFFFESPDLVSPPRAHETCRRRNCKWASSRGLIPGIALNVHLFGIRDRSSTS